MGKMVVLILTTLLFFANCTNSSNYRDGKDFFEGLPVNNSYVKEPLSTDYKITDIVEDMKISKKLNLSKMKITYTNLVINIEILTYYAFDVSSYTVSKDGILLLKPIAEILSNYENLNIQIELISDTPISKNISISNNQKRSVAISNFFKNEIKKKSSITAMATTIKSVDPVNKIKITITK